MSKLPVLTREVVALLGKLGFMEVRQRFSPAVFATRMAGARPYRHQRRDISPTLLRQIAKDIGVPIDDLLAGQSSRQPNNALAAVGREVCGAKEAVRDRPR